MHKLNYTPNSFSPAGTVLNKVPRHTQTFHAPVSTSTPSIVIPFRIFFFKQNGLQTLIMILCAIFVCSGSACSILAGLESMGLADVHLLVKLMCLSAAGRIPIDSKPASHYMSTSVTTWSLSRHSLELFRFTFADRLGSSFPVDHHI